MPQLVGAEEAVRFIVENPLRQNRMLRAQQAFEAGYADALFEPVEFLDESLAFLLDKVEEGRRKAASGGRSLGRRRGVPQGALPPRRPGPRRDARAVSRARSHRRRRDLVARGGLPRRGGRAGRPPPRPGGSGLGVRVQPRRAPRETRRRDARRRAAARREGRRRRRGAHGAPARAALPAPSRSAGRACATSRRSRSTRASPGSTTSSPTS